MTDFTAIDRYIEEHLEQTLAELTRLCSQPSISATGEGIAECAVLVADMFRQRGFTVEIVETQGNPIIYAEADGTSEKTLLFYNHYDVQSPEPLDLWTVPPFDLTRRDGKLYARGISDDKGHIVARLAALDAVKAITGSYPCRVKFVIEGEEETSSANLPPFVESNAQKLQADAGIWEYGMVNHEDRPLQILGLRGICYVELRIKTANLDAHSGIGGSVLPNAAWRLVWALNTLKDEHENILIDGFYDHVRPLTDYDLELIQTQPDEAQDLLDRYGAQHFVKGLTGGIELRREQHFVLTCTICGLTSGYQGAGPKTIVPSQASAKIDFRLVPDQDPADILAKLRKHLDKHDFTDIDIEYLGGNRAGKTDSTEPIVRLAIDTAREVYGKEPVVMPMMGGSGPNALFIDALHVPIITTGVSYPGDRLHAPDENIRLNDFVLGVKHMTRILTNFNNI